MKLKFVDVPEGGCFASGSGRPSKKLVDGRCASITKKGKQRIVRCPKQERDVQTTTCPLSLLGAGLSGPKRGLVEIGRALPHEPEKRKGRR